MSLNVLVVDDSSVMRTMIIRTLRLCGLALGEIHQAANGQEGLQVLEGNRIDLALVDINMPIMNGAEMLNLMRQNPQTAALPVIIVSTEGSEARIEFFRGQGAEFVHKPFTPEALRETIVGFTGVTDGEQPGEGAVQSGGLDF